MGHSVQVEIISPETAEHLRNLKSERLYYGAPDTFASRMVNHAVSTWSAVEAGRYDSPRAGDGHLTPFMTEGDARRFLNSHHDLVVSKSVVIPIVGEDGLTVKRRTATVEISAAEAREQEILWNLWGRNTLLIDKLIDLGHSSPSLVSAELSSKLRKPVAKNGEGKLETVYYLVDARGNEVAADGAKGFSSLAEAKAAGVQLMTDDSTQLVLNVRSKQVRLRDDAQTQTLATISRPETALRFRVEFETRTIKPNAEVDHYMVAFDYHH